MRRSAFYAACQAFIEHGRDELHKCYHPDSCIESSAVVISVLDYFGIRAEAVYTQLVIYNEAAALYMAEKGRLPEKLDTDAEMEFLARKGKILLFGHGTNGQDAYDGHVVAVTQTQGKDILIDLTLDNVNRPEFNIMLPPIVGTFTPHLIDGHEVHSLEKNKCRIEYTFHRDRDDFRDTIAWKATRRRHPVIAALINHTKDIQNGKRIAGA